MQLYWVSASHTGRYARLTSLGLYVMYAQAVQSVCPVESTAAASEKSMSNFSKALDIVMEHGCSAGSTAASDDASLLQPQKVLNRYG